MIYLDTSCLLKLYVREQGSVELAASLTGKTGWVCAHHGRLELISALKRHQREKRLDGRGLALSLAHLERDEAAQLLEWLPLTGQLIKSGCERMAALPPEVFLRAADALHLACAADAGLTEIHSHDQRLLAAAPHFGLKGVDVPGAG